MVDEITKAQTAVEEEVTIFDRIVRKEIPAKIIYEDEHSLAFRDINPVTPTHFLVIPKNRNGLTGLRKATEEHAQLLGHLLIVCAKVAKQEGLEDGYRTVINDGKHSGKDLSFLKSFIGQTVFHLHIHVIGGKQLSWPPGV